MAETTPPRSPRLRDEDLFPPGVGAAREDKLALTEPSRRSQRTQMPAAAIARKAGERRVTRPIDAMPSTTKFSEELRRSKWFALSAQYSRARPLVRIRSRVGA